MFPKAFFLSAMLVVSVCTAELAQPRYDGLTDPITTVTLPVSSNATYKKFTLFDGCSFTKNGEAFPPVAKTGQVRFKSLTVGADTFTRYVAPSEVASAETPKFVAAQFNASDVVGCAKATIIQNGHAFYVESGSCFVLLSGPFNTAAAQDCSSSPAQVFFVKAAASRMLY